MALSRLIQSLPQTLCPFFQNKKHKTPKDQLGEGHSDGIGAQGPASHTLAGSRQGSCEPGGQGFQPQGA